MNLRISASAGVGLFLCVMEGFEKKCFTCIDTNTSVVISILFRNVHHSQVEPPLKTSLREKFDFEIELETRQEHILALSV